MKAGGARAGSLPFNVPFPKLRYVNPWPKPLQKPHPPIWRGGGGSVETWKFETDHDYTYSYLSFMGHKYAKVLMDGYWDSVEKAGMDDNPYRAGFAQLVVVADTDAEAERIYLKHLRNFYSKSLYVAPHFGNVPGFMTKRSFEFQLSHRAASPFTFDFKPHEPTWKQLVEYSRMLIGGSPATVAEPIEEAGRNIRVGPLMVLLQTQYID